ncbi:MAG: ATP synthase F1 subunit epsilon, partial [Leptospiraceae bacterium]|nr:ATP synthase F1 subunit epsilon [Leptospiraceae bacterium]
IVSPAALLYENEVKYAQVPVHDGLIGVLPGHAAYISMLGWGMLTLHDKLGVSKFVIDGGFLEIAPDRITVLANHAENLDDVDQETAEKNLEEALLLPAYGEVAMQVREQRIAAARTRLNALKDK